MSIPLDRIENQQMMEVYVSGPDNANRLYMFSGIAVFRWLHSTDERWEGWADDLLHISMLGFPGVPRIFEDQVVNHQETGALTSFSFSETRKKDTWGYSVNSFDPFFTDDPNHELSFADFGMEIHLSMRGYDARMFHLSFQMNVLARV